MYPLGEHFKIKLNPVASESNIIKGQRYRITVLTENLIRLEYSSSGNFVDAATELAWNRNFGPAKYEKREDSNILEITTSSFKLTYLKEKNFIGNKLSPDSNLKVNIVGSDSIWYYGCPEVKNLGTSNHEFGSRSTKEKGLYSLDGYVSIDDSNSKILLEDGTFENRSFEEIDVYLFVYRKDFMLCLKNYFALTGNPPLLPRYALGNWWSKTTAYQEEAVKQLVEQFSKKKIPISIFLLDNDWHIRYGNLETGFTFHKDFFKEPSKLVHYLHEKNIKLGLSVNPTEGFLPIDDVYKQVTGYLQPDEQGVIPIDVLNPRWIDVYLKMYIHPLDNFLVDFYWLKTNPRITREQIRLLQHYQFYDKNRSMENRALCLSEFTGLGSHRYSVLYSGKQKVSWETLGTIPYHNLQATNMGISWWAHDIGGYYQGIEESELYIRFVQLGVFSPILKFGSFNSKYYKREPWKWDIKTYSITREYLNLRHQLIPYLYSLAYQYYKNGIPLIKPLYYENEELIDDIRFRNQYYLGKELLVCPITTKKDIIMNRNIHQMYIPAGTWYDFVSGKKFPGNKEYVAFFTEEEYPVFARSGSIIPMAILDNINDTNPPKKMEFHIFPGCSNHFQLYEDDGKTNLYLRGNYLLTDIDYKYEKDGYTLTLKALEGRAGVVPDYRDYKFRFRNVVASSKISVLHNGSPIEFTTYVDGNDFIIEVKNIHTTGQLQIKYLGENFEIEATRIMNTEIDAILNDLQIDTEVKEQLSKILFGDLPIKKKRIEVRKLKGLEKKFQKLFLKLLEYIEQV